MNPIPCILDTDIGSDIDDTWALAFLLRCPELEVKLVTSATANTVFRARLTAKFLHDAGRTDIPVGVGIKQDDGDANQGSIISGYELSDYPGRVHEDGVAAIIDTVRGTDEPITLIGIAPTVNIAAALRRAPDIAGRCHFVGMYGSIASGSEGAPGAVPEHNVKTDIASARAVFAAQWRSMTITPLDSCGRILLQDEKFAQFERSQDPLARLVLRHYDAWWAGHPVGRSTVLFDTVAVYLAFARDLLDVGSASIEIDDEGYTRLRNAGPHLDVAFGWRDLDAFEDLLLARLAPDTV